MADGGPSGKRPRRASARLVAAAESALPPLLRALTGDPLRAVAKLLPDAALTCFRLVCRAFRDHSSPALKKCRGDFLRTRALVAFAWAYMPGFVNNLQDILTLAASVGCVGVLEELVDVRQCALTAAACEAAAKGGHLDALAWLHSRACPWGATCYNAAEEGHLEVLRYAHEHGCPWDFETCNWAAYGGHLEMLRYAHEHDCPWDHWCCYNAAEAGQLEALRYAHEQGCPWDSGVCTYAAQGGHLEVLRYAHEHGCLLQWVPSQWEGCMANALSRGHTAVVEYLRAAQPAALAAAEHLSD
jgi:hypothetical protein